MTKTIKMIMTSTKPNSITPPGPGLLITLTEKTEIDSHLGVIDGFGIISDINLISNTVDANGNCVWIPNNLTHPLNLSQHGDICLLRPHTTSKNYFKEDTTTMKISGDVDTDDLTRHQIALQYYSHQPNEVWFKYMVNEKYIGNIPQAGSEVVSLIDGPELLKVVA